MKNILKGFILFIIIVGISLLMPGLMDSTTYDVKAGDADFTDDGTTGTGIDPFTVVEIVPYKGMDEIGYLVGGQEPVDQELLSYDGAYDWDFGFLSGAIDVYRSYEERVSTAFGVTDGYWRPAKKEMVLNGYFENVGHSQGGYYSLITRDRNAVRYDRVADGTGNYTAVLNDGVDMEVSYNLWNDTTNKRNVNAYFVLGKPAGVNIFNSNLGYAPLSVTENSNHNGDYDYNVTTKSFYLNKGNGKYDVIFTRAYSGNMYYTMEDNLEIVDDGTGTYSYPLDYDYDTDGDYVRLSGRNIQRIVFDLDNGEYRFVQDDAALTHSNYDEDANGRIWVKNQKITVSIQYHYKVQLVNNEWFKTLTLGIPADKIEDYPVEVVTITPEDLSKPENQHYIDEADLFYINAREHNSSYIKYYELYSNEGKNPANTKYYNTSQTYKDANLNFAVHDLNWDSVNKIFLRAAGIGCKKAAMIIDNTYYADAINGSLTAYAPLMKQITRPTPNYDGKNSTRCNLAKLYIMVYQRNMVDFYNAFMKTDNPQAVLITKDQTRDTGSFIRPDMTNLSILNNVNAAIYWNGDTFMPYGLNAAGNMVRYTETYDTAKMVANGIVNYNVTASNPYLTNNVLTLSGSNYFSDLKQSISIPSDAQSEAAEQLSTLNADGTVNIPTSFSLGSLLKVVTNEGDGYENVGGVAYPAGSVVEGLPADIPDEDIGEIVDDGTDGSGLRSYKRVLNIQPTADFTSSEATIRTILSNYDVQIINMTSMQFNSSIEDINSMYDMIFMGSSAGRFNWTTGYWWDPSRTDFNNDNLNNSFYFATGDTRAIRFNNTNYTKYYRGNDITVQKRSELDSFLDAGYPIVLDSKLYAETGISYSVNLEDLIEDSKSTGSGGHRGNFLNVADYSSSSTSTRLLFKIRLITALNVERPLIDLITPLVADDAINNYIYVDPVTELLTVKFSLLPKGNLPSTYTYSAYLYIDDNGDGIFDTTDKLNLSEDSSSTTGLRESKDGTYIYNYYMNGYNGVYQWKLVVLRTDNSNIHSNVTGYVANSNESKEVVKILHIRDNTSPYSLQSKINDTASLFYQYAGDNALDDNLLDDYRLDIKTMTVNEFQQQYVTKAYSAADSSTNKLASYHMLIMDTPITAIFTTNGARTNIIDEIAKDLSVIYTKQAINYENQDVYYNASAKYSFQPEFTYNYLNRYARLNQGDLYIYNSLTSNGSLTDPATYQTTYLTKTNEGAIARYPYEINQAILSAENCYSDYVPLDFNLSSKKLIGWYCLSDTKSPLVRDKFSDTFSTPVSDADLYEGLYSTSPNDVKNNYYLFSNGLCYYSGITLDTADELGNDEEIKLFVNTIIAAYKTTDRVVASPQVMTVIDPDPVDESPEGLDGYFYIRNVSSGLLMEVANASTADLALIQQNKYTNNNCQKFKIVSTDNGYYNIYTGSTNYTSAIDVSENRTADGTSMIQYHYHGETNQQFEIIQISPGKYAIKTRITGSASCMDDHTASTNFGYPITQWRYTGANNQLWSLEPADRDTINVTDSDIVGGVFNLTFDISDSSSNMDMTILLNNSNPVGSWNSTIYKLTGETIGPAIAINTSKVSNGTYILKIPAADVITNNVLTFAITNGQGNMTSKDVKMIYVKQPVVVIEDPKPLTNASKGYLYVDIDFNAVDTDEDYLDSAEDLLVIFSVDKASNYTIDITSKDIASSEEDLTDGTGYDVTVTDEDGNEVDLSQACTGGVKQNYTMHIPVALMKGLSSREIVITATDSSGAKGEASVTLLRRSLFPLD